MLQINYREKNAKGQIQQIKTCRKKRHVRIGDVKEMPDLICGKSAVGGNYNSTRDNSLLIVRDINHNYIGVEWRRICERKKTDPAVPKQCSSNG